MRRGQDCDLVTIDGNARDTALSFVARVSELTAQQPIDMDCLSDYVKTRWVYVKHTLRDLLVRVPVTYHCWQCDDDFTCTEYPKQCPLCGSEGWEIPF